MSRTEPTQDERDTRLLGRNDKDDPMKACRLEVPGRDRNEIIGTAKRVAARVLGEHPDLLRAECAELRVIERYRFVANLSMHAPPTRWSAQVTVRLDPETVKARRQRQREHERAAFPMAPEDR